MIDNPFFILGCVRSGTTLLRDLLRQHPNLACPEETHFFRWGEPFGTGSYDGKYHGKKLFKQHRELDKVSDFDFFCTLKESRDRRMLMDHYARIYLENNDLQGRRWFDKTPQNVYGVLLIAGMYPKAQFVHIHRHPYNVISSLKSGRSFPEQEIKAAVNFWLESLTIINQFKQGFAQRIIEISYEALVADPQAQLSGLLTFLGEKPQQFSSASLSIHPERNNWSTTLSEEEIAYINEHCQALMQEYGYESA